MFLSFTSLLLVLSVILCIFLLQHINKTHFETFANQITEAITENESDWTSVAEDEQLQYLYNTYLIPVSETKKEVSIQLTDDTDTISNDQYFDEIFTELSENNTIAAAQNEIKIQKLKTSEKTLYYYSAIDVQLSGEVLHIQLLQNMQVYSVYSLILTIVTGSALLIVVILILTLGRFVSKRALAPLQDIADAVKDISEENLAINLQSLENVNEVDSLIIALNNMLRRLDIAFDEQKRFVSDVSHELRIPITIIQGYLDIIRTWGKTDETMLDESLEAIYAETTNMKDLVEKLLLLQNLGSGNYRLELEKTDINQLLQKAIFETKLLTQEHTIVEWLTDADPFVYADKNLLSQAIRSIIDNGIKYTNAGGTITISSRCDRHHVFIEIADNGCGISKENLAKVKERFYRVDSARTKETGGSGLGLSIVNASVGVLGGELVIKSEVGRGSQFTIILPRKY
jgi:signal transduction histidine kinase